jgi:citrate synthase
MTVETDYLTAREAAELLGVKLATLYAYASRGLIESVPGERGRQRLYRRMDLDRLRARRLVRGGRSGTADGLLSGGDRLLETSITALTPDSGPVYRGRSALELAARDVPFELVAELLWTDSMPEVDSQEAQRIAYLWSNRGLGLAADALRELLPGVLPPLPALSCLVPLLACRDGGRFVQRADVLAPRARTLVLRMAASLALTGEPERLEHALSVEGVAAVLAAALGAGGGSDGVRALNRALVLVADHEFNAATLAARAAASTGADVYACVQAALATQSGPGQGGAADRIEALIQEVGEPGNAERALQERARRGEPIEGFGHPRYPEGDPRAGCLLDLARDLAPESPRLATCIEIVAAAERESGGRPTVDIGLAALAVALDLDAAAAAGILAIGRSVGWVAHVLEQYQVTQVRRGPRRSP